MSDSLIEQSAARLFSENVDKSLLERFEAGTFPDELWDLAVESGFGMALASEEAGGIDGARHGEAGQRQAFEAEAAIV